MILCVDCLEDEVQTEATETWDFDHGPPIPLCLVHFKARDNWEPSDAQREARESW